MACSVRAMICYYDTVMLGPHSSCIFFLADAFARALHWPRTSSISTVLVIQIHASLKLPNMSLLVET